MKRQEPLTVKGCAAAFGRSEKTIRRHIVDGVLPAKPSGGQWLIEEQHAALLYGFGDVQFCPTRVFVAVVISGNSVRVQLTADSLIESLAPELQPTARRLVESRSITPTCYNAAGVALYEESFFRRVVSIAQAEAKHAARGEIRIAEVAAADVDSIARPAFVARKSE